MAQSSVVDQSRSTDGLKGYSCLICRQRKVKCDRHNPCTNCVKTQKTCSFVPPVRGKRKKTKPPKEGLHAKVKRYEELLSSCGVTVEPLGDFDGTESETMSQFDDEMEEVVQSQAKDGSDRFRLEETNPKLLTKEGSSRYIDNPLWSNIGAEFENPEIDVPGESSDESHEHESELFLLPERNYHFDNLATLHVPLQMLPKLRDIYIDRVDPLMKIVHVPTFYDSLTIALGHPQNVSRSFDAMAFAFYLAIISTLKEDECQSIFQAPKSTVYPRYRLAARQALVKAGFLSTSSLMTLRAYTLFLMCSRNTYKCETLFIMSGVAIRLARKMGLHRDGASMGLSIFDTEMRRRLWAQLVLTDFRTSDVLGTRPSLDLSAADTKKPLNVNDEDLHPEMAEFPPERSGITSSTLCLIGCEIMEALKKFSAATFGEMRWESLSSPEMTPNKRDSVISQIEDHLEKKYLRYCDPSNTLHTFVSIMIRSAICKMKLFAHNPRQFADRKIEVSQSERDIVFLNATKLLEYVTLLQGGSFGLEKYLWQMGSSYLSHTMLYVLIETRHRRAGPEVDRVWQLIGEVFSYFPQIFQETAGAVYIAMGKWTLEVWDDYVAASRAEGRPEPAPPAYIDALRRARKPAQSSNKNMSVVSDPVAQNPLGHDKFQPQAYGLGVSDFQVLDSYDFPDLMSFEMDPNEWIQWEQLVAEQKGFPPV